MLLRSRILQAPSPVRRMIGAVLVLVSAPACDLFTAPGHDQTGVTVRWRFSGGGASVELYADRALVRFYPPSGTSVERPFAPVYGDGVVYVVTAVIGIGAYTVPLGRRIGHVVALSATSGATLWRFEIPEAPPFNGGAVGPGVVAGDVLIVGADNGRVYGLDRGTGTPRWVHQGSQPYQAGAVIGD